MLVCFIMMSIALSIDALGIGISYRLNGVLIPLRTKIIIGVVTTVIMLGALALGGFFYSGISATVSKVVGVVVLVVIGIIFIRNSLFEDEKTTYDFDNSREIEPLEGILLAVALSADSVGAGIAVASTGLNSCVLGVLVGAMQLFFLFLADYLVNHVPVIQKFNNKVCGIMSGILLILIGLFRCFG